MKRSTFYASVRHSLFGGQLSQTQVDGMEGILNASASHGDDSSETLAYAMATAFHETGRRMTPVRETFAATDDETIRRLDSWAQKTGRSKNIYWRRQAPFNEAYFGRGHVQLTWKDNYERSSVDAGVDLVKGPSAMLDPEVSARVLFKGLLDGRWNGEGRGIRYYLDRGDLKNARRTVNSLDKWSLIAGYYGEFLDAINAARHEHGA